jgi:beta-N-acetylhexosaminidase
MPAKNDLQEAVGQLLIMGFDGTELSPRVKTCISTIHPGGVILFARNIAEPAQTHALLCACQELAGTPLFRCVDMEGGTVDRLKNVTAAAPSPADVFASGDKKMFRAHGRLIGEGVRALGFNTDFAPVFDLALPPSRNVLRSRTVSPDPNQVVLYAREFLAGLRESGVLGCGKHFPGLGEASLDSHHELPVVHKSWQRLWDEDLYPYRALRRQIPFLMVAHAAFPGVTGNGTPASLSRKWITEILRKEIGYRGLVISDDLDMAGVLAAGSIEHAAVETIRAGADIFLVCRNEEHLWRSYKAVLQEAERDQVFARQVKRAARRLLAFKKSARKRLQLPVPPTAAVTQELRERLENFTETLKLIPQPAAARPTTAAQ